MFVIMEHLGYETIYLEVEMKVVFPDSIIFHYGGLVRSGCNRSVKY